MDFPKLSYRLYLKISRKRFWKKERDSVVLEKIFESPADAAAPEDAFRLVEEVLRRYPRHRVDSLSVSRLGENGKRYYEIYCNWTAMRLALNLRFKF